MRLVKSLLIASALIATSPVAAHADNNVVASIKPVHSLTAAVMDGVGKPGLIVEGAGSPHTYAMTPSQAAMLQKADIVFWIGHHLEAFLEKPLENIATKARSVELFDTHGLVKQKLRDGSAFDAHGHAGKDDHDNERKAAADDDHGAFNAHVWLDPMNAKVLVSRIKDALAEADPTNAATYSANSEAVRAKLDALTEEVAAELQPVMGRSYIVFHDAYQNFEARFGLSASGSITVSPEVMPGAERLKQLRAKVQQLGATCVFSEPQFQPKLVETVIEGTDARAGVLDPLGTLIEDGPELYFTLIRNMAAAFTVCLGDAS